MTPSRLASWITMVVIVGCLGCIWNEETTLGHYQATDSAGNVIRYLAVKNQVRAGYIVAKAIYPHSAVEPKQVSSTSIQNFQQLKKWLKEEKSKNTNMQKEPD